MEDVDTQSTVQLRGKPLIFSEERVSESVQDYPHLYALFCQDSKDTKKNHWIEKESLGSTQPGEHCDIFLPVCAFRTGGNTLILDFVQPLVCLLCLKLTEVVTCPAGV